MKSQKKEVICEEESSGVNYLEGGLSLTWAHASSRGIQRFSEGARLTNLQQHLRALDMASHDSQHQGSNTSIVPDARVGARLWMG